MPEEESNPTHSEGLLRRWRDEREESAARRLEQRYRTRLAQHVDRRLPRDVRARFETQDLVQEILTRAISNAEAFEDRGRGSLWAWMRGISNLVLRETWRKNAKVRPSALDVDDSRAHPADRAESPLAQLERDERGRRVLSAIGRLPDRERKAVLMRIEMDLSFKALARALEFASPDAARMAVARALERVSAEVADADSAD